MTTTQLDDGGVGLSALLGDDEETFSRVVDGRTPGPLAVIGSPFGGRETVLARAADRLDARHVRFDADTSAADAVDALAGGPTVVEGCHHLYTRTVGGFRPLSQFLDSLAETETTVVTGWNRFAWSYLDAVRNVGTVIPTHVEINGLSGEEVATFVEANATERPTFRRDETDESPFTVRRHEVTVADRTVSVPLPALDRKAMVARRTEDLDPKTATFERLATVSDGNPGVALAIWKHCVDGDVRPTDIETLDLDADLNREAAFCLRILLSTEWVDRATLADRIGPRTPRLLGQFARAGVVTSEDGTVRLQPAGVPAAVAVTERWGVL
ncbi:hypothetical protein GJ631_04135 [Natronomonas sp. CBA1123]|uniref:hypothetical protein n=1 Tax=Natronomonas sp. CBA1123 TaxID=2668070 RepID=UPI0012EA13E7|nr:hypothetical protein [Natronomonas sp. CBA1123]MUV85780.1 hypothetical protein [Natronomonas sp. CBA1123]